MLQRGVRTSDGQNCGLPVAASADFSWPKVRTFSWPRTPCLVNGVRNTASGSETAAQRCLLKGCLRWPVPGTGIQRGGQFTAEVLGNVVDDPRASRTEEYITCRLVEPGQCCPDGDCPSPFGAFPAIARMSPTEPSLTESVIGGEPRRSRGERHLRRLRQERCPIRGEEGSGGDGPVEVGGVGGDVAGLRPVERHQGLWTERDGRPEQAAELAAALRRRTAQRRHRHVHGGSADTTLSLIH